MGSTSYRDLAARKRKQRFSEEQTKSLESMFESEGRLEPGKKLQLAGELGLQPRQVAIWFQNRRARCKSKQLEREYGALRAEYEALQSSFESLKKEKLILNKQLQILVDLLEEPKGGESDNSVVKEERSPCPSAAERLNLKVLKNPNGNGMERDKELLTRFSEEEGEPYVGQLAGGIPAWPEQHFCSPPSWPSDQLTDDASQWCEFWPMNV